MSNWEIFCFTCDHFFDADPAVSGKYHDLHELSENEYGGEADTVVRRADLPRRVE